MIMKKTMIVLSAVLALVACNKETPVKDSSIDASKFVVNITVNHPDATKAVKSGWVDGDKVYVFFDGVTGAKYVELTRDGSSWTPELQGGLTVSDLNESGDNMYGVYFPYEQPVIAADGDNVTFKTASGLSIYTYYMTGSGAYEVDKSDDITTLTGSMDMVNPNGYVQFYIGKDGDKYNASGKYRLSVAGVKPTACTTFSTSAHTFGTKELNPAQPMWGYKLGDGVAFSGVIDDSWSDSANSHVIYLFDTEAAAKTITISGKTLSSHAAVNFSSNKPSTTWSAAVTAPDPEDCITYNEVKWAKFNLGAAAEGTAAANYGWYFLWGDIVPATGTAASNAPASGFGYDTYYPKTVAYEALNGKEVNLTGDYAIYDMATAFLGPDWRMPTKDEYVALCESKTWGGNSSVNANSVVFPAAGYWSTGTFKSSGLSGQYWSSSYGDVGSAFALYFIRGTSSVFAPDGKYRLYVGVSVRPVHK